MPLFAVATASSQLAELLQEYFLETVETGIFLGDKETVGNQGCLQLKLCGVVYIQSSSLVLLLIGDG